MDQLRSSRFITSQIRINPFRSSRSITSQTFDIGTSPSCAGRRLKHPDCKDNILLILYLELIIKWKIMRMNILTVRKSKRMTDELSLQGSYLFPTPRKNDSAYWISYGKTWEQNNLLDDVCSHGQDLIYVLVESKVE